MGNRRGKCGVEGSGIWIPALADGAVCITRLHMNRLRKDPPPAMSRTLAIATGGHNSLRTQRDVQPRTSVEQYWAARALKAETSLSVRDTHQLEVQHIRDSEETKRTVRLCNG